MWLHLPYQVGRESVTKSLLSYLEDNLLRFYLFHFDFRYLLEFNLKYLSPQHSTHIDISALFVLISQRLSLAYLAC